MTLPTSLAELNQYLVTIGVGSLITLCIVFLKLGWKMRSFEFFLKEKESKFDQLCRETHELKDNHARHIQDNTKEIAEGVKGLTEMMREEFREQRQMVTTLISKND
jgi:hypothetical protein